MTKIAFIDDNSALLESFAHFFEEHPYLTISYIAHDIYTFEQEVLQKDSQIDILFLDINLPNETGLDALPRLKEMLPNTEIIMFTIQEDSESLIKAFCRGATGYILKDSTFTDLLSYIEIVKNGGSAISASIAKKLIQNICNGQKPLSILNEKEYQILELLSEGWSYKLIADKVNISIDGVRFYIKRIYRALNVNSKGEAIHVFYTNK